MSTEPQAEGTLSVTDSRTGQTYEFPITDGTVRATDLRQIKTSDDDFGLMTYDPAFMNTASCRSAITYLDGDAGVLRYRGYPIEQLAAKSTFLEVAWLLIHGELPTAKELEGFEKQIVDRMVVQAEVGDSIKAFAKDAHPMGILEAGFGHLSTLYPEAKQVESGPERMEAIINTIAKMPTIGAMAFRHNQGKDIVAPDPSLDYSTNILKMFFGADYEVDPRLVRALDILLILHADHEQNCSTSAVRAVGSSQVDTYSAVNAGIAALYGPLHGGANEAVLVMLREIGSSDNVSDFMDKVKSREALLMGFGHRVYKNYDPRATIIKGACDDVFEVTGVNPLLEVAVALETTALADDFFIQRKLYPNVDFYSGLIYEALGIPTEMFTVMFAIGRAPGWVAQWLEMIQDKDQKISRPRQIYIGSGERDYVEVSAR
ncbi:MAG: citrate synthase [Thermoleophilia bacterium]|jgi:citrate synthase|nr:citrate synthase [Thermoleophilia bacterium]